MNTTFFLMSQINIILAFLYGYIVYTRCIKSKLLTLIVLIAVQAFLNIILIFATSY